MSSYHDLRIFPYGITVDAEYREPSSPINQTKNPLLDALPPLLEKEALGEALVYQPDYQQSHRELGTADRDEQIQCIPHLFLPRERDIEIAGTIGQLIRDGYRARHPLQAAYIRDFVKDIEELKRARGENWQSKTRSSALFGVPGLGKTTSVTRALCLFPQVIVHPRESPYGKQWPWYPANQIVYLRLACPKDGSMRMLCIQFFAALDEIFGGTQHSTSVKERTSAEDMIPKMDVYIKRYFIGIIVIDDIQNLNAGTSGGAEAMLNYFGLLEEKLKVPILLVGTFASQRLFATRRMSRSRRITGYKGRPWGPMEYDEEWKLWCMLLWRIQYTKKRCPFSDEICLALHDVSAGIPDLAVKADILAQADAFGGTEIVDAAAIRMASAQHMGFVKHFVAALKSGDANAIIEAEDLSPLTIEELVAKATQQRKEAARSYLSVLAGSKEVDSGAKPKLKEQENVQPALAAPMHTGLRAVLNVPVCERAAKLKELGFRRDALEFFPA